MVAGLLAIKCAERRRAVARLVGLSTSSFVFAAAADLAVAHHVFVADREKPRITYEIDRKTSTSYHLTDTLSLGAGLEVETELEENLNLDDNVNDDDEFGIEPKLELGATWEPNADLRFYAGVEFSRDYFFESAEGRDPDFEVRLEEAYVAYRGFESGPVAVFGRQSVKDERGWLVDRKLDGIRLIHRFGDKAIEGLVARQELVPNDLLGDFRNDRANNFLLRGQWGFTEDSEASAYVLHRNGRDDSREKLFWLGAQSLGEITDHSDYWLDAAAVFGEANDLDVAGFGFDVGGTYVLADQPMRPAITLGFAYGSGDEEDGGDAGFRQTSMQYNYGRFGGVSNFKYYGETLDPELSNLAIVTAAGGVRPTDESSVDLVYHRYFQAKASDDLRDTELDADPNGQSTDLGHGIDLVLGFRGFDPMKIKAIAGVFLPGDAFEEDDPAFRAGLEFSLDLDEL